MPTEVQHTEKKRIAGLFHIAILTGCLSGFQSVARGLFFYIEKFVTLNISFAYKENLIQKAKNRFLYPLIYFAQSSLLIEGLGLKKN